jgi:hypothetical protein
MANNHRSKSGNPITANQPGYHGSSFVSPHSNTLEILSSRTPLAKANNPSNACEESTISVSHNDIKRAAGVGGNGNSVTKSYEGHWRNSSFVTRICEDNGCTSYLVVNSSSSNHPSGGFSVLDNESESTCITNPYSCNTCDVPFCTIETRERIHTILDDTYHVRRRVKEETEAHEDEWYEFIYQEARLVPGDHELSRMEVKQFFELVLEKIVQTKRSYRNSSLSQQTLPMMYPECQDNERILKWIEDVEWAV